MRYFDAHAHIQFPEFEEDRGALLADLQAREVGALVVGVNYESSQQAIELADSKANRFAAVGLHPNYVLEESFDLAAYRALALDPSVVAIGECGLDNFRPEDVEKSAPLQREVFLAHIALAAEVGKPLMIHSRPAKGTQDAYQDLITLLEEGKREHGDRLTGNVHFFVGGIDEARRLIDLGFTVSYTAVLTFARDYDEVVRFLPLDRILTETDAPYAAPPPNRGKRNDPRSVERVVEAIADIRGEDREAVREQVLANARQAFRI